MRCHQTDENLFGIWSCIESSNVGAVAYIYAATLCLVACMWWVVWREKYLEFNFPCKSIVFFLYRVIRTTYPLSICNWKRLKIKLWDQNFWWPTRWNRMKISSAPRIPPWGVFRGYRYPSPFSQDFQMGMIGFDFRFGFCK